MLYKTYTHHSRKFIRLLRENGYKLIRQNGSHSIYKNDNGNTITININLNAMVARRLIRENNLKFSH